MSKQRDLTSRNICIAPEDAEYYDYEKLYTLQEVFAMVNDTKSHIEEDSWILFQKEEQAIQIKDLEVYQSLYENDQEPLKYMVIKLKSEELFSFEELAFKLHMGEVRPDYKCFGDDFFGTLADIPGLVEEALSYNIWLMPNENYHGLSQVENWKEIAQKYSNNEIKPGTKFTNKKTGEIIEIELIPEFKDELTVVICEKRIQKRKQKLDDVRTIVYSKLINSSTVVSDVGKAHDLILEAYDGLMLEIFHDVMKKITEEKGPPPVKFQCVAAGSYARNELSTHSDIDAMVLIQENKDANKDYFNRFNELFKERVSELGELFSKDAPGFRICPIFNFSKIGTPAEAFLAVTNYEKLPENSLLRNVHVLNGIRDLRPLFGYPDNNTPNLVREFQELLAAEYQTIGLEHGMDLLKLADEQLKIELHNTTDIKKSCYRSMQYFVQGLALYFQVDLSILEGTRRIDVLIEKSVVSENYGRKLKLLISHIGRIRILLQCEAGKDTSTISEKWQKDPDLQKIFFLMPHIHQNIDAFIGGNHEVFNPKGSLSVNFNWE